MNRLSRDLNKLLDGGRVYSLFEPIKGESFDLKNVLAITDPYCQWMIQHEGKYKIIRGVF